MKNMFKKMKAKQIQNFLNKLEESVENKRRQKLKEAGRIKADLSTIDKIASYTLARIRKYSGYNPSAFRITKNSSIFVVSDVDGLVEDSVWTQVSKELESNDFTLYKRPSKFGTYYYNKLKHKITGILVYLPIKNLENAENTI